MRQVAVSRSKRILAGHPWIFANELAQSPKGHQPGELVEVVDRHGVFLGIGYINPASLIAVRLLTRQREAIDKSFFRARIAAALARRERWIGDRCHGRLVFGESDGLPGLIVDRYSDCLAVQLSTAGMEALRPLLLEVCDELLAPRAIVLRNDVPARALEGLPLYKEVAKGAAEPPPEVEEDGVRFAVDLYRGQKTGLFLDQRDNRVALRRLIGGGQALDLFCYTGAWALHLAAAGAQVTGVDASAWAIQQARENALRNRLQERVRFVEHDVLDYLRRSGGEGGRLFDAAVVDPPAFVKSKSKLRSGLRAYRELNALVFGVVKPGGIVASSSCSHHVDRQSFIELLRQAARDAQREVRLLALRGQALDHPIALAVPETEYLKCAFLEVS
ncbi:MAG: class I SAM-dependent rRNA methyltransferase [Deltaproteobacteria bacterium]|nr:class I SAM-dependent rRNA methyltransferase [Deltaproteobacteria bacterium]